MKRALQTVLAIAVLGMVFSGTLTYRELCTGVAGGGPCTVPGSAGTILGYPACVYGLLMYALVAGVAIAGLMGARGGRDPGWGGGWPRP